MYMLIAIVYYVSEIKNTLYTDFQYSQNKLYLNVEYKRAENRSN